MNSYLQLINRHRGSAAFIFGAGPSLWHNMQNSFFYDLKKYGTIISVNSSIMACKEPNFWISCDSLCMRWSWWPQVLSSGCIKIVRNSWLKYKDDIKGFYIFNPRKTPEDRIDYEEQNLMYCNSTNASIDFGIQLVSKNIGSKNIFILGLDHKLLDGKHHFWQFFPKNKQPRQIRPAQARWETQKSVFPIHLQSYKALKEFAEHKNVKIYNCNPESKVEVFEKIKFGDVEKIIKEKEK